MEKQHDSQLIETFIREVNVSYRTRDMTRTVVTEPEDVARLVRELLPDNSREHFVALFLDGASQVAAYSIVSSGTANSTLVHPREIFQRAILAGAVAVVVAHNHPSGVTTASQADIEMTRELKIAGEVLGITLLDHLIVTDEQHVSLRDRHDIW